MRRSLNPGGSAVRIAGVSAMGARETYTAAASLPGGAVLDNLTKETFEPIRGSVFELALDGTRTIPLELSEILGNGLKGHAKREQFALHFRGPASPALVQRIYR